MDENTRKAAAAVRALARSIERYTEDLVYYPADLPFHSGCYAVGQAGWKKLLTQAWANVKHERGQKPVITLWVRVSTDNPSCEGTYTAVISEDTLDEAGHYDADWWWTAAGEQIMRYSPTDRLTWFRSVAQRVPEPCNPDGGNFWKALHRFTEATLGL